MKLIHRTLDNMDIPRVPISVTPDFRIALLSGLVAIGTLIVAGSFGDPHAVLLRDKLFCYVGSAGWFVFAAIAVRSTAGELERVIAGRTGPGHAGAIRWLILLIGYLLVALTTLELLRVSLDSLLFGGAITGIVLGIAAQQSLANFFAGVVLLLARPFNVGDRIRIRSGALGGELTGTITGMGLTYVTLMIDDGALSLPNAAVLAAGIGPAPEPAER